MLSLSKINIIKNACRLLGISSAAVLAHIGTASAGGFDIHEQSTVFLGSASAGSAAGGSLGSMFWNPAATAQFPGLNTESSYTLILPYANVDVSNPLVGSGSSGNIGIDAVSGASYAALQINKDLWVGLALNSPFGLATKPDNVNYPGSYLGVTTKLLTINANPTIAYRIAPGITIGAGLQIEWAQAKLQFRDLLTQKLDRFGGADWAFGGTAGVTLEPFTGTTIGLGYRSQLTHNIDGSFSALGGLPGTATVNLPDIVTLSGRQVITPTTRLLGTVEWTNWSRFKNLPLSLPSIGGGLNLPTNWADGWFFSVGGEYDYTPYLTLRTGVAYEMSPIDSATGRIVQIPDNNRVWLSVGASYKWTEATTFDIGYSHIFIQDGGVDISTPEGTGTLAPLPTLEFKGESQAAVDLVSFGMRTRW
ncbi:Membrane protein involved in aromatic hydrocarbon degradation [Hyphomicrobium sp. MC1]|nr:Membrane protein involved in aromatic hydrocarbon degradation [Hyphomicrobium sp. MC1]